MTRRRFSLWSKLLALAGSTFVALVFAELLLRLCWHNPYAHEQPDRVVRLRLQHAGADHQIDRSAIHATDPQVRYRINDRSYIEPSQQYSDPDYTIAFLGGSTTECCAVAENLRFPALVSSKLADRGIRVSTLNAGTSGNTVHDSINVLLNHVIQDAPDVVVLMHACNDVGLLARAGNYDARAGNFAGWTHVLRVVSMKLTHHSFVMGVARQAFREHTHFVPTDPQDLQARPQLEAAESIDGAFEKRLRAFVALAGSFSIEPVLMTQPISGRFTQLTPDWIDQDAQVRFNNIVRRVGRESGVFVIDLVEHLQQNVPEWDRHMHLFYDGIHVTDQGSRVYGEYIAAELGELLHLRQLEREQEVSPNAPSQGRPGGGPSHGFPSNPSAELTSRPSPPRPRR